MCQFAGQSLVICSSHVFYSWRSYTQGITHDIFQTRPSSVKLPTKTFTNKWAATSVNVPSDIPADTQRWNNVDSTLIQRFKSTLFERCVTSQRRFNVNSMYWRWINVESTLFERCVPAGMSVRPAKIQIKLAIRSLIRIFTGRILASQ